MSHSLCTAALLSQAAILPALRRELQAFMAVIPAQIPF